MTSDRRHWQYAGIIEEYKPRQDVEVKLGQLLPAVGTQYFRGASGTPDYNTLYLNMKKLLPVKGSGSIYIGSSSDSGDHDEYFYFNSGRFRAITNNDLTDRGIVETDILTSQFTTGIRLNRPIIPHRDTYLISIGTSASPFDSGHFDDVYVDDLHLTNVPSNLASSTHTHDETDEVEEHTHDGRYYTETESDAKYSLTSHTHPEGTHNHDSRYYTETEANTRYARASHTHSAADIPADTHSHDNRYSRTFHTHAIYTPYGHSHSAYSATDHTHSGYAATSHTHDARYYTETEADARYATAAHVHPATDVGIPAHTHPLPSHTHPEPGSGTPLPISSPSTSIGAATNPQLYARARHLHGFDSSRLESGGTLELDGDNIDISFSPSNYSRAVDTDDADYINTLQSHLEGIDDKFSEGVTPRTDNEIKDIVGGMFNAVGVLSSSLNYVYNNSTRVLTGSISNEYIQDLVSVMFTDNSIAAYDDPSGKIVLTIPEVDTSDLTIPWENVPSTVRPSEGDVYALGASHRRWTEIHGLRGYFGSSDTNIALTTTGQINAGGSINLNGSLLAGTSDIVRAGTTRANRIRAYDSSSDQVELDDHLDFGGNIIRGLAEYERSSASISPPDSIDLTDGDLADLNAKLPSGSMWLAQEEPGADLTDFLSAVSNFFGGLTGVIATGHADDDNGKIFIRTGDNIYVFESAYRIGLNE